MSLAAALLAGVGVFAVLAALVAWLQRASFLVRQVAFPLYVGAAAAAVFAFTLFPAGATEAAQKVLTWTLLFLGFATILRLLGLFLFDVHLRGQKGMRLPPLLPAVAMGLVYLVAAFTTLRIVFPQVSLGPLLATSAITSLVLGLALQPILGNFFAGLVISLERPFRINDWVKVGEREGRVVAITWRTTHLRTRDNDNLVIPNGRIADETVLNYYYPHPMHLERIQIGAHYGVPPYRVRRSLLECAAAVPEVLDKPSPEVFVLSFGDSAVLYELRVWIEDIAQGPRIASDLRARIWEQLKLDGIPIPYPTRTLEITRQPRSRSAEAAGPPPARLFVAEGPERGRSLDIDARDGGPAIVGRSRACSLPLTDANASKEHLKIEWTEEEGWVLTDLGSSFGTRVNGRPETRAVLAPLDRIAVGDTILVFETDAR